MQENTDQKNSVFGHFSRSVYFTGCFKVVTFSTEVFMVDSSIVLELYGLDKK